MKYLTAGLLNAVPEILCHTVFEEVLLQVDRDAFQELFLPDVNREHSKDCKPRSIAFSETSRTGVPDAALEYDSASKIWLIIFASGQSTSMGCDESLASSARALERASEMNDECTFHSGKTLRTRSAIAIEQAPTNGVSLVYNPCQSEVNIKTSRGSPRIMTSPI